MFCFTLTRSFVESAYFVCTMSWRTSRTLKKINFAWKGSRAPEEHNNVTKIFVFARSWTYTFKLFFHYNTPFSANKFRSATTHALQNSPSLSFFFYFSLPPWCVMLSPIPAHTHSFAAWARADKTVFVAGKLCPLGRTWAEKKALRQEYPNTHLLPHQQRSPPSTTIHPCHHFLLALRSLCPLHIPADSLPIAFCCSLPVLVQSTVLCNE